MTKLMTLEQIQEKHGGEWVLIGKSKAGESAAVIEGEVVFHSRSREDVYAKARQMKLPASIILFFGDLPKISKS